MSFSYPAITLALTSVFAFAFVQVSTTLYGGSTKREMVRFLPPSFSLSLFFCSWHSASRNAASGLRDAEEGLAAGPLINAPDSGVAQQRVRRLESRSDSVASDQRPHRSHTQ